MSKLKWWLCTLASAASVTLASADQSPLFSPTVSPVSGLQLTNNFNSGLNALNTCNSGATAPANQLTAVPSAGNCWLDTSITPYSWKVYDGTQWVIVARFDQVNHYWIPTVGGGAVNSIASAATTDLCNSTNGQPAYVQVTGVVGITSFGSSCITGQIKFIVFTGVLTMTHNAASLILPNNGSNVTTAAGDTAAAIYLGGGNWRVSGYSRANGQALQSASSIVRQTKTANYSPAASDQGTWIDGTTGTWTLSPVNPATLGNGWWIYWSNSGTGNITITPAAGTIDGLSTFVSYPGEARIIASDGVNLNTIVVSPFVLNITATGATTFTTPPKYSNIGVVICGAGGGGAGGHRSAASALGTGGGAGGGGSCQDRLFKAADIGASQTVTIATGGTGGPGATVNGTAGTTGGVGGNSTFGALLTAYGGGGGGSSTVGGSGGAGAGIFTAGASASGATQGLSDVRMSSLFVTTGGNNVIPMCDGGSTAVGAVNTPFTCPSGGGGGGASSSNGNSNGWPGSPSSNLSAPGGGGGGGHTAGNLGSAGGAGGKSIGCATATSGGAAGANNGGSTAADFNYHLGCGGGGGGGANGSGTSGGNGGAGTNGGAGGGGGSGDNANAGAGGAGGNGFALIRGNM